MCKFMGWTYGGGAEEETRTYHIVLARVGLYSFVLNNTHYLSGLRDDTRRNNSIKENNLQTIQESPTEVEGQWSIHYSVQRRSNIQSKLNRNSNFGRKNFWRANLLMNSVLKTSMERSFLWYFNPLNNWTLTTSPFPNHVFILHFPTRLATLLHIPTING